MAAGRLRDRVEFQTVSVVADGGGGGSETWTTQFTVWGGFKPQRGREALLSGQSEEVNGGVLRVRSSTQTRAITANYIAVIEGERYSIVSPPVNIDRRERFLEMIVQRGGAVA